MSRSNQPFYIPTNDCSPEFLFFASQPRMIPGPSNLVTADDLKKKNNKIDKIIKEVGLPNDIYEKEISTPRHDKS